MNLRRVTNLELVKDENLAHLLIPTVLWIDEEPLPSVNEYT